MSADIFEFVARACRPMPRREHPHTYHAVLLRDDVTVGELAYALRASGIVITTDPASGQTCIHRSPTPKDAA